MTLPTTASSPSPAALARGRISSAEWRFVGVVIAVLLVITSLPYLFAALTAPADKQYMGIMINVPDHAQYFSWFKQYLTQDLASNRLTPEPNQPIFFNLLWWLLAKLGAALGWGYAAMFQVLRVTVTAAFLVVLYRLCAWFFTEVAQRRTAFLLTLAASGFGWVLIALKYLLGWDYTLETWLLVYIVEPNTFFGLLSTPHLVGAALYILAFEWFLRGQATGQWRYAIYAGLFTQFLGWQHAYDLFLVYGILGLYGLLRWLRDRRLAWFLVGSGVVVGVLSVWPALYSVLLTSLDPLWREVLAQFDNAGVFTPAPWLLPVLLGPAFLLALWALFKDGLFRLRDLDDQALFLRAWFWGNFLLVYVPTNYQIKMLNGWQVPISLLATHGLFTYALPWLKRLAEQRRWPVREGALRLAMAGLALLVAVPTNLYLYAWRFVDLARYDQPYYLTRGETEALAWLEANTAPESGVMASLTIGQYVPALTGRRAFLAHWAQTVDYFTKAQLAAEFYSPATTDERRLAIARAFDIGYVYYGPAERALGVFAPAPDSPFAQVFDGADVDIYRVQPR